MKLTPELQLVTATSPVRQYKLFLRIAGNEDMYKLVFNREIIISKDPMRSCHFSLVEV